MIFKISRFWRIQCKIKQLRVTVQRRAGVIIIVGLFLVTAILPSTAHIVTENSLALGLPTRKNTVSQGEVLYQAQTAAVIYPIILPNRLEIILKLPGQKNLKHYATNKVALW